jgi:WD40 repeat protein
MNVLSKSLHVQKNLQIKGCREVQFSHGGHMFAVGVAQSSVQVYNFYTGEALPIFKGHTNRVRSICWFPDDMGFVSSG